MSLNSRVVILARAAVVVAMGGGELLLSSLSVLLGGIIRFRKLESINCLINCEDEAIIVKL